jgi:hypothetical protein
LSVLGPQNFACLREAASAKAGEPCIWAFLSSPKNSLFQQPTNLYAMVLIPFRSPEENTIDCGWHHYSKTEYSLPLSAPAKRFRFERDIQTLSQRIITTS